MNYNTNDVVAVDDQPNNIILHLNVATPVYNSPILAGGQRTGVYLSANSDWQVNAVKIYNGQSWVEVGKDQWVALTNGSFKAK